MTITQLHDLLLTKYGERGATVRNIATELNITDKDARFLTQALGYHNTKRTAAVSFGAFCTDSDVVRILAKINSSCNSKTSY